MKIRSTLTSVLAAAGVAAGIVVTAPPADAASALRIYKVYVNSPGSDTRSNSSLNAEWVQIRNYSTTTTKYLTGWTIRDNTGYTYKFPSTAVGAGKSVYLHTGKGSNYTGHRYWQRSNYVWNNTGDKATLKNSAGTVMSTCSWGSTGSYKIC